MRFRYVKHFCTYYNHVVSMQNCSNLIKDIIQFQCLNFSYLVRNNAVDYSSIPCKVLNTEYVQATHYIGTFLTKLFFSEHFGFPNLLPPLPVSPPSTRRATNVLSLKQAQCWAPLIDLVEGVPSISTLQLRRKIATPHQFCGASPRGQFKFQCIGCLYKSDLHGECDDFHFCCRLQRNCITLLLIIKMFPILILINIWCFLQIYKTKYYEVEHLILLF